MYLCCSTGGQQLDVAAIHKVCWYAILAARQVKECPSCKDKLRYHPECFGVSIEGAALKTFQKSRCALFAAHCVDL